MRVLIYGTGAIGGLIGAGLARAGHEVVCLARAPVAQAIRERGLQVEQDGRVEAFAQVRAAVTAGEAFTSGPFDAAVFAMKAYDTQAALDEMTAATASPPPVLCVQNGIGNEESIAERLGAGRVIAGTVTTAALMNAPGVVTVERERGIGLAHDHPLADRLAEALAEAGMHVVTYPDARAMKWTKVLVNIVANPISAICDMRTEEIFSHAGLYRLEVAALREALRVMRALGLPVVDLPRVRTRLLARAIFLPPRLTQPLLDRAVASGRGSKMPSFNVDLARGKSKSEVVWLNGAVAREAERLGVPAPVNRALTDTLMRIVRGQRAWEEFRRKPEALLRRVGGTI